MVPTHLVTPGFAMATSAPLILADCSMNRSGVNEVNVGGGASQTPVAAEETETTQTCEYAFADADAKHVAHYNSHPFYSDRFCELGPEEQSAILADEEAAWMAIIEPIYDACSSPADFFYSSVYYPAIFGYTSFDGLDLATEAEFAMPSFCDGREEAAACTGWEDFTNNLR